MTPYYADEQVTLWLGDSLDVLRTLPVGSVNCCVTSPPYYGLRDYGEPGQYGLEASPAEYVETIRAVFAEVRRVLADDGTLWLNLGDSYASNGGAGGRMAATGMDTALADLPRPEAIDPAKHGRWLKDWGVPPKNLLGLPWRVAFALQADGWWLRNAIVWHKPNAMPDSVTDRLGNRYELVFLLAKSRRYWFDLDAIKVISDDPRESGASQETAARLRRGTGSPRYGTNPGLTLHNVAHRSRNPGDVWTIPTQPFPEAHFAVMTPALAERCVLAGCKPGGTVLDPFAGSGTTGMVAAQHGRRFVGIDLSREYLDLALRTRLAQTAIVDGLAEEVAS